LIIMIKNSDDADDVKNQNIYLTFIL
jgi:hypothetical protein